MTSTQSRARVVWDGNLMTGHGRLTVASDAIAQQEVKWASRTQRAHGTTSPEELLAAAHASCFAMALSHSLAQRGNPPTRLEVSATCTFAQVDGGFKISTMDIEVRGQVPGLDKSAFEAAAHQADIACPVSNALRGNVEIRVNAQLEVA